jgi:uncharacterized protein (TIGR03546 family)
MEQVAPCSGERSQPAGADTPSVSPLAAGSCGKRPSSAPSAARLVFSPAPAKAPRHPCNSFTPESPAMITRSIGKVLRGKATPLQLALACILGSLLGFLPGYADGGIITRTPGLFATLVVLLVILNANLPLAALIGGLAKLASMALMPVSFEAGRLVIDGPGRPAITTAVNAPGLALFGLEYYTVTGGMLLGLAFGALAAVLIVYTVTTFRRRMQKLEEGSEAYQKYAGKGWVKAISWLLFGGGKGKKTYAELLQKKAGNPVRILGVVAVILAAGLVYIGQLFFKDEIVTNLARTNLERANGATVDLGKATLDLKKGQLLLTNLAIADPEKLQTDLFRAKTVEATVSTRDLLRKRIAIDQLTSADASTGETRLIPGTLTRPRPEPTTAPAGGQKTIDDYIKDAQQWKERLAQLKDWLEKIDRQREQDTAGGAEPGQPGAPGEETLRDRLRREIREMGYTRVAAWHLIEKSPTLLIRKADLEGLRAPALPGKTEPELMDVRARNISTQPWLVADAPQLIITSRGKTFDLDATLGGIASTRGTSMLKFAYRGIPADLVGNQLKVEGVTPLSGGTIDLSSTGTLSSGRIDLPLQVTLRDSTMTLPQAGSAPIKEMLLAVGITGPLENPAIFWDQKAFADALTKAGADQLAAKARGEVDKAVNKATAEATKKLEEKLGDKLGDKVPTDLKDKLPGGLPSGLPGGLLPKKKQ